MMHNSNLMITPLKEDQTPKRKAISTVTFPATSPQNFPVEKTVKPPNFKLLKLEMVMINPSSFIFCVLVVAAWAGPGAATVVQQQQLWCVARNNAEDSALQQALDWACGPGAANCGPIQQGGPCYDPSDIISMASYAFNDYCSKHGMTEETCNFSNTADLTALDPSHDKCKYPSSAYSAGNSSTPSTAGVIPGSEDMNGSYRSAALEVWTLALMVITAFL